MEFFPNIITKHPRKSLVAVAAAAVGACLLLLISNSRSSGLAPALTEDEAKDVMNSILVKLRLVAARMLRAAEGIRQQIEAQGQQIDDAALMKSYILPHFETAYRELVGSVLTESDVDEYDLEDAVNHYTKEGNTTLIEICTKIRLIYKEFGGDVDVSDELSPDGVGSDKNKSSGQELSVEKVLEILQALSKSMGKATDDYIQTFLENHDNPSTSQKLMEDFHAGMISLSEDAEKMAIASYGISPLEFQRACMQFQNNTQLQTAVMTMQLENQQRMRNYGIDFSSMQMQ